MSDDKPFVNPISAAVAAEGKILLAQAGERARAEDRASRTIPVEPHVASMTIVRAEREQFFPMSAGNTADAAADRAYLADQRGNTDATAAHIRGEAPPPRAPRARKR